MATWLLLPSVSSRCAREFFLTLLLACFLFCPAILLRGAESATPPVSVSPIKVDQVGYLLYGPKVALVTAPATSFQVRRTNDNGAVFHGTLSAPAFDANSCDQVQAADFTGLQQGGTYYIDIPGLGRSWNFAIGANVFDRTYYLAMRAFYGQRCGTAVDLGREFPGYSHGICHQHAEFHPSSGATGPRNNVGG